MADQDVIEVLLQQHEEIRRLFDDVEQAGGPGKREAWEQLVRLLAVHEVAEEIVVRPITRAVVEGGDAIADERLGEEHAAKEMLSGSERLDLDAVEFSRTLVELRAAVLAHAEREERDEFPRLRQALSSDELHELGVALRAVEVVAPTHPHPRVPDTALGNLAAGPLASIVDRTRDVIRGAVHSVGARVTPAGTSDGPRNASGGIPHDPSVDSSLALLREGYTFISTRVARYQSDLFGARVMLRPAVFGLGAEAARAFYEPGRFTRTGSLPITALKLLQDKGSVQMLDGDAHRWRKQMFMSLMTPEAIDRLTQRVTAEWHSRIRQWGAGEHVVLFDELQEILCRAVCAWAGIPLSDAEAERRTREFAAMIDGAGAVGPRNWAGMVVRARSERWARDVIADIRAGKRQVDEGTASHVIAWHRDLDGRLLDVRVAAVELINVLRPTVAVARFITFAALALHHHPECLVQIRQDDGYVELFVQEVRRFYPFFPLVGGRAREAFSCCGHELPAGTWFMLDVYGTNHDPRIWGDPETFRPERFRHWDHNPLTFIPQGGGSFDLGHRCAGEWITIQLMCTAVRLLATSIRYDVPEQDLSVSLSRMPAIPRSRFIVSNVGPPQPAAGATA